MLEDYFEYTGDVFGGANKKHTLTNYECERVGSCTYRVVGGSKNNKICPKDLRDLAKICPSGRFIFPQSVRIFSGDIVDCKDITIQSDQPIDLRGIHPKNLNLISKSEVYFNKLGCISNSTIKTNVLTMFDSRPIVKNCDFKVKKVKYYGPEVLKELCPFSEEKYIDVELFWKMAKGKENILMNIPETLMYKNEDDVEYMIVNVEKMMMKHLLERLNLPHIANTLDVFDIWENLNHTRAVRFVVR